MKSLLNTLFLFLYFGLVFAGCNLIKPNSYTSPYNPTPATCNIPYTVKWNQSKPLSSNIEGWVYFETGAFDALWFTDSSINLNGSYITSFDCNYIGLDAYFYLKETGETNKYTCRSLRLKFTKCGNGVLDFGELCENSLGDYRSYGCTEWCKCDSYHYHVGKRCCPRNAACYFNTGLIITGNNTDFRGGVQLTINGDLELNSTTYIDSKTKVEANCVYEYKKIYFDAQNVKKGDTATPLSYRCSNNPPIEMVNISKCLTYDINTKNINGFNVLSLEFKRKTWSNQLSECSNIKFGSGDYEECECSSAYTKLSATIIVPVVVLIVLIIVIMAIISPKARAKIFPWRKKQPELDDNIIDT